MHRDVIYSALFGWITVGFIVVLFLLSFLFIMVWFSLISATLETFCVIHASLSQVMDQVWYQEFVSDASLGNRDMLFDLLTAANFMGIKELLDLACLKVTFELTGKNAEQIRQILRLPHLSPEEEAQAREDHKWIFEDA